VAHTLLIADDDQNHLTAIQLRLRSEGYEVVTTTDSYQALHQAQTVKPDALILDINMPAGDGFTVQERLGRMEGFENVPVIYLDGENSERVKELARANNAFALLFKPYENTELLDTIAKAIESKQSAQAA